jgi:hypothetical protein
MQWLFNNIPKLLQEQKDREKEGHFTMRYAYAQQKMTVIVSAEKKV